MLMRRPTACTCTCAGHPKTRILCEFLGDADAWQARVGGYAEVMRNFKDLRTKTHFETQNKDWVRQLVGYKRHHLSLKNQSGDASGSAGSSRGR